MNLEQANERAKERARQRGKPVDVWEHVGGTIPGTRFTVAARGTFLTRDDDRVSPRHGMWKIVATHRGRGRGPS